MPKIPFAFVDFEGQPNAVGMVFLRHLTPGEVAEVRQTMAAFSAMFGFHIVFQLIDATESERFRERKMWRADSLPATQNPFEILSTSLFELTVRLSGSQPTSMAERCAAIAKWYNAVDDARSLAALTASAGILPLDRMDAEIEKVNAFYLRAWEIEWNAERFSPLVKETIAILHAVLDEDRMGTYAQYTRHIWKNDRACSLTPTITTRTPTITTPSQSPPTPSLVGLPPADDNLHVIHCSTGLGRDFRDSVPPVSVVSVLSVHSGAKKSFAAVWLAQELGIPIADFKSRHPELEKELLRQFYAFVAERPNAIWLHSNMRSSQFGFEVLERRAMVHRLLPVAIPDARRFDLYNSVVRKLYPDPYFGHPRQEMMFRFNFGNVPDLLTEEGAAAAWSSGDYTALVRSAEAKVGCIAGLYDKLSRGETLNGNPRCLAGRELDRFSSALADVEKAGHGLDPVAVQSLTNELIGYLTRARAELMKPHPRGSHRAGIDAVIQETVCRVEAIKENAGLLHPLCLWCRTDLIPIADELKNDGERANAPTTTTTEARKETSAPAWLDQYLTRQRAELCRALWGKGVVPIADLWPLVWKKHKKRPPLDTIKSTVTRVNKDFTELPKEVTDCCHITWHGTTALELRVDSSGSS